MLTRSTDAEARVSLPKSFANSTVIIDRISETEVRIRRAVVIPEDEIRFGEETVEPLSDRDRDRFIESLENPTEANDSLKQAARKHSGPHG